MKADWEDSYEMRKEYDFSKGIKNVWFQDLRQLNLVSLDADVKAAFPDSQSVNAALRGLIEAKQRDSDAVSARAPEAA